MIAPDPTPAPTAPTAAAPAAPTAAGASAGQAQPGPPLRPTFPGVQLQPWYFWTQTADPAMDGDPGSGPNATLDCGPESTAMCLAHLTDVQLDADYIWDC